MKKIFSSLLIFLLPGIVLAQSGSDIQLYNVHDDDVKPHLFSLYEQTAEKLANGLHEHNLSANFFVLEREDLRFLYFRPVRGLDALHENTWGILRSEMPEEYAIIASDFRESLITHGNYILELHNNLSYNPDLDETQRKHLYLYVSPNQQQAFLDLAEEIRTTFISENLEVGYRVYKSGYGNRENYFIVEIARDDVDKIAESFSEYQKYRQRLLKYLHRIEVVNVEWRPDLSYEGELEFDY